MTDSLAIAWANTRSSMARDHIATLTQFRQWARARPTFAAFLTGLRSSALPDIRAQRDATQLVLHQIAAGKPPSEEELQRATRAGLAAASFRLRPARGGIAVDCDAPDSVTQLLSRVVVDFLLSPQVAELHRCQGADCHKVFISTRADRRWCDSRVCGNRARVAAHARRRG